MNVEPSALIYAGAVFLLNFGGGAAYVFFMLRKETRR